MVRSGFGTPRFPWRDQGFDRPGRSIEASTGDSLAVGENISRNFLNNLAMPMQIVPFTETYRSAAEAFNRRMAAGKAASDFLLPTDPIFATPDYDSVIKWTRFVVVDGEDVRGGVLKMDQ